MPDRVVDVVAADLRQRQRPAWRLDWRRYAMNTNVKLAAALVAVLAIAVVGYSLRPAGAPAVGAPPTQVSPAPTAAPSASPGAAATFNVNGGCGLPLSTCRGSLAARPYTSRAMEPALTYTVPVGWFNKFDEPGGYGLLPETAANMATSQLGWIRCDHR